MTASFEMVDLTGGYRELRIRGSRRMVSTEYFTGSQGGIIWKRDINKNLNKLEIKSFNQCLMAYS